MTQRLTGAATIMLAVMMACVAARAQERAGDAALGALSGAIIFGPAGAVAGALVGYTAGPSIARGWGLREPRPHRHVWRKRGKKHRATASTPPYTPTGVPTAQSFE